MGKAVNGIEDCLCPLSRAYWSRYTHGDITEDGAVIELDVVTMKASDGVSLTEYKGYFELAPCFDECAVGSDQGH